LDRQSSGGEVSLKTLPSPLAERLAQLAAFGATEHGIDRRLFSAADAGARALFVQWARASNFTVEQDRAGNVFVRRAGRRDGAPVLSGSHLDTVPTGGAYDGAYGAIAALCALEELDAAGIITEHPVEAVAWAGEEGSRFPLGCLGSGAFAGLNDLATIDALCDEDGITFADARKAAHGLLPDVPVREGFPAPAGYVELHIEQGPVLEHRGVRLGVVTAIAGQARFDVEVHGESGHAGTVPMDLRRDALSSAAELVLELEAAANEIGEAVLTVGRLVVFPNQTNVIPGRVTMRIDARSVDEGRIRALRIAVVECAARVATQRSVRIETTLIEERRVVPMDHGLRDAVAGAIAELGEAAIDLPSGAGHDAMCVASVAPVAMIFVPSAGGRSHVGNEYTTPDDLQLGVTALTRSIVAIDRLLEGFLMRFFICGSALTGQPDHQNLGEAKLVGDAQTAAKYRLHSVRDEHPGIYEVAEGGVAIKGEIYEMSEAQHAHLISTEPPDLYESPIELEDGSKISAMIYPRDLIEERKFADISQYGGWAAFKKANP
jgi:N-carbamoyl-L-amino-acid hydrolase